MPTHPLPRPRSNGCRTSTDSPVDRTNWSYLLLADESRRASADPRTDLRELFGRMCFNAAVSNLDDHPRNHAIIARDRGWRLSPAFDLTPSPVIAQDHRDLAMTCGRFGRYANRANLLSGCGRFLLPQDEAAAIFERIVETVRAGWRPTMQRAGVSRTDCDALGSAFVYPGLYIAEAWTTPEGKKHVDYFWKNKAHGITTFEDGEIEKHLRETR